MANQARHKRQESVDEGLHCPWVQPSAKALLLSTPGVHGTSRTVQRGGMLASREGSGPLPNSSCSPGASEHEPSPSSVLEGTLKYKGVKVRVKSSHTGISWKPAAGAMAWCLELAALKTKIPYDEVLGAWSTSRQVTCSCTCRKEYALVVAALVRPRRNPNAWRVEEHRLVAGSLDQAKEWVAAITSALQLCYDRPRNLLVFINPHSGSRRARHVWAGEAAPVFLKAGIKFTCIETLAPDHARITLAGMKADELAMYQGVVAVGGDGVFQECVMGLVAQRGRGGKNAAVAARLRLGHIPGGSTDAVAYTLHGTRSAEAAALHIALGDRLSLDVARVDCLDTDPPSPSSASAPTWLSSDGGNALQGGSRSVSGTAGPRLGLSSSGEALGSVVNGMGLSARSGSKDLDGIVGGGGVLTSSDPRAALCSPLNSSAPVGSGGSVGAAKSAGVNGVGGAGLRPVISGAGLASRHFVCQAAYGFLGDVMHFSEKLRCMGPSRYDLSGLVQFLRLRSYPLTITYRPAPCRNGTINGAGGAAEPPGRVCAHPCEVCRMAGINLVRMSQEDDPWVTPTSRAYTPPGGRSPTHLSALHPSGSNALELNLPNTNSQMPTTVGPAASSSGDLINLSGSNPSGNGAAGGLPSPATQPTLLAMGSGSGDMPSGSGGGSSAMSGGGGANGGVGMCAAGVDASGGLGWVTVQGEYVSVMAVVTPCRSDKSPAGILPHAHLSDGRLYLVMVSKCGRLDYLRFLIRLSTRGLEDNCFPFVKIVPITAAQLRPGNGYPESVWNVDGELLPSNTVRLRVQRGLVDVFARGVEQTAS